MSRHPIQCAFHILISISDALIPTMVLNGLFSPTSGLPLYIARVVALRLYVVGGGWPDLIMDSSLGDLDIYAVAFAGDAFDLFDLVFLSEAGSEQRASRESLAVDISHEEDARMWHQKGKLAFRTGVPHIVARKLVYRRTPPRLDGRRSSLQSALTLPHWGV